VETQKLCTQCHDLDKAIAPRQDQAGWAGTVEKMVAFGMTASRQRGQAGRRIPGEELSG
jgi:hypothetical protein